MGRWHRRSGCGVHPHTNYGQGSAGNGSGGSGAPGSRDPPREREARRSEEEPQQESQQKSEEVRARGFARLDAPPGEVAGRDGPRAAGPATRAGGVQLGQGLPQKTHRLHVRPRNEARCWGGFHTATRGRDLRSSAGRTSKAVNRRGGDGAAKATEGERTPRHGEEQTHAAAVREVRRVCADDSEDGWRWWWSGGHGRRGAARSAQTRPWMIAKLSLCLEFRCGGDWPRGSESVN
mmetsp:Transcript_46698/g.99902  ORF Transcript_46698/g.99902 Transcript_46698/m.99902 type:complete len:235 (-) Transcript_46698:332-1036(-)